MYGGVLTFYEPLDAAEGASVLQRAAAAEQAEQAAEQATAAAADTRTETPPPDAPPAPPAPPPDRRLFSPKSLVVLSHFPFYSPMRAFLKEVPPLVLLLEYGLTYPLPVLHAVRYCPSWYCPSWYCAVP